MLSLSINTYIHLLFVIVIFCCLVAESILIKRQLSYQEVNRLTKIDGLYGFAAIMVVGTGLLNWLNFGKGAEYYNANTFFIVKFSLFVIVGLLSLYPTIILIRTKKRNKSEKPESIDFINHKTTKRIIYLELVIMATIPLLAELMANGIDF